MEPLGNGRGSDAVLGVQPADAIVLRRGRASRCGQSMLFGPKARTGRVAHHDVGPLGALAVACADVVVERLAPQAEDEAVAVVVDERPMDEEEVGGRATLHFAMSGSASVSESRAVEDGPGRETGQGGQGGHGQGQEQGQGRGQGAREEDKEHEDKDEGAKDKDKDKGKEDKEGMDKDEEKPKTRRTWTRTRTKQSTRTRRARGRGRGG